MLDAEVWGDGDPEGVRQRAAERMKDTARAAAQLGVEVVTGFTGSPIWHLLYSFPPNDWSVVEAGYQEFAERWGPIIDVFDAEGVRFALEVHPTEIAYDFGTTRKALDAIGNREGFGINFDPSHFEHQFLDSAAFIAEFGDRIYHAHIKDSKRRLDGRSSILGGHLDFGQPGRGWDFVSPGHGDVDFEAMIRALNRIGYDGPLSIEWEDSGMDRDWGAPDALAFVRRTDFAPSTVAFDAAFAKEALMSEVGFVTMGDARSDGDVQPIGVGMLGYAFMGKAHSNAYKTLAYMTWPPPLMPRAGGDRGTQRGGGRRGRAALRVRRSTRPTGRRSSPTTASQLFDNAGPEQPARRADDRGGRGGQARDLREAAGPRRRRVLRDLAARQGRGRQAHVRLQLPLRAGGAARARRSSSPASWARSSTSAAPTCRSGARPRARSGASTRRPRARARSATSARTSIDLARYLVGEIAEVSALTQTFLPGREVDDAVEAAVRFENGAVGTIEASRFCQGRKNHFTWEINGSKGSLAFDLERLNELEYSEGNAGFRTVLVSEADHPFWEHWWPQGHMIGWEHSFVHELHHLLTAIRDDGDVAPHGATLEDGYRAAEICDAMLRSAGQGARETVSYRS